LHYRGQKADIWEGGHRVPFLVHWPAQVAANTVSDQTICLTDLMATALDVLGESLPAGAGQDSYSFLAAITQTKQPSERMVTIHHSVNGTFAIRKGDWKLIPGNLGSGGFSSPRVVKPKEGGPGGQLYNLRTDPSEKNNVWQDNPKIIEELQTELQRMRQGS
ncbi:MAG: sulfatase-like hydrolase/transferase, partial [Planctomycetaceae bacterium]|nr:sulfatase-like hydrolase/transferase [Planctomycetaceae bacterium]